MATNKTKTEIAQCIQALLITASTEEARDVYFFCLGRLGIVPKPLQTPNSHPLRKED